MKRFFERCVIITCLGCAFFGVSEAFAQKAAPPVFTACVPDPADGLTCDQATAGASSAAGKTCQTATNGCDCR